MNIFYNEEWCGGCIISPTRLRQTRNELLTETKGDVTLIQR